ncbi:hydroxypyruvate isomerase [Paucimonas lemoignei]|uniref:Hydroxypyruvate isomerase n=1 Tax=Paucimonas lemoignei TaxID=29443 RepID=A0A4R3I364_PAULE|nr:2-oxo-tetronate isomerase [Paucimonas lemoignei]TCS39125.1 hydroxypyruvate isomerase [Paucimonas lemoignei]
MPQFAANLALMYNEHAFLDRFAAAAADGFRGVEFLFPYDFSAVDIRARLDAANLTQVLFNAPPGDWAAGERGIASLPGREEEFRCGFDLALEYAGVLGNRRVHVMAGLLQPGVERARQREVYLSNLAHAARVAAGAGMTVLIEPINPRDMPGYFLNHQAEAHAIRHEIGAANIMVQCDLYHCQIVEGDLAATLRRDIAGIGHIQIAGVPQRHEPDIGEINYPYLFELMDELGYAGWVGCEYRPRGDTSAGLEWLRAWRRQRE